MGRNEMKNLYFAKRNGTKRNENLYFAKRNGTKRNEKSVLCEAKQKHLFSDCPRQADEFNTLSTLMNKKYRYVSHERDPTCHLM